MAPNPQLLPEHCSMPFLMTFFIHLTFICNYFIPVHYFVLSMKRSPVADIRQYHQISFHFFSVHDIYMTTKVPQPFTGVIFRADISLVECNVLCDT